MLSRLRGWSDLWTDRSRLSLWLGTLAVLLGAAVAVLIVRIESPGPARAAPPAQHYRPARSVPASTTTTGPAAGSAQAELAALPSDDRAVAYVKGSSVAVYPSPGAAQPSTRLDSPNSLGAPLVFLVDSATGNWLDVELPQRPNGSTGWIPASAVTLYSDDFQVVVHLGIHQLQLFQARKLVSTYEVAVGNSASPTPPGSFYVTELVSSGDPNGAYGPYAFGLSDFSNTYSEFDGGPGQIAIHGTDEPWVIGTAASHGCIRLNNTQLVQLVKVLPVGTPVVIDP